MSAQDMAASLRTELTGRPLVRLPYFSVHGNMHHAPQALQCAQWMLDLRQKYKVSQPPNAQRNDRVELVAGRVAMIVDGTWAPAELHDSNPKFRIMLMPIPRGPHGKTKGTVSWDNMLCMA